MKYQFSLQKKFQTIMILAIMGIGVINLMSFLTLEKSEKLEQSALDKNETNPNFTDGIAYEDIANNPDFSHYRFDSYQKAKKHLEEALKDAGYSNFEYKKGDSGEDNSWDISAEGPCEKYSNGKCFHKSISKMYDSKNKKHITKAPSLLYVETWIQSGSSDSPQKVNLYAWWNNKDKVRIPLSSAD